MERAAGGIVIKDGRVLIIRDRYGHVTFPKGHMEPFETEEQTAVRETREETGIVAQVVKPIGRLRYPLASGVQKEVVFFSMRYVQGEIKAQSEEIAACFWLPFADAKRRLAETGYEGYPDLLARAIE